MSPIDANKPTVTPPPPAQVVPRAPEAPLGRVAHGKGTPVRQVPAEAGVEAGDFETLRRGAKELKAPRGPAPRRLRADREALEAAERAFESSLNGGRIPADPEARAAYFATVREKLAALRELDTTRGNERFAAAHRLAESLFGQAMLADKRLVADLAQAGFHFSQFSRGLLAGMVRTWSGKEDGDAGDEKWGEAECLKLALRGMIQQGGISPAEIDALVPPGSDARRRFVNYAIADSRAEAALGDRAFGDLLGQLAADTLHHLQRDIPAARGDQPWEQRAEGEDAERRREAALLAAYDVARAREEREDEEAQRAAYERGRTDARR